MANSSTARPEWVNATGWDMRTPTKDWHGVVTREFDEGGAKIERVRALMLPMNGLCGTCGSRWREYVWFTCV